MTVKAFDLGRDIWEARVHAAWGAQASRRMALNPWPPHEARPERAAEHDLAIETARAALKKYEVKPK